MRKKSLVLVVIMILSVLLLSACGGSAVSDSPYVGKWVGTTAEYAGMEWDVASLLGEFTIDLESGGKAVLTVQGETTNGKWSESDAGVVIDEGSDNEVTLTAGDDGRLSVEMEGMVIYFEKEGADAGDSE